MSPTFRCSGLRNAKSFKALCEEMSKDLVTLFEKKRQKMERAFRKTDLSNQGGNWRTSRVFVRQYVSGSTHFP